MPDTRKITNKLKKEGTVNYDCERIENKKSMRRRRNIFFSEKPYFKRIELEFLFFFSFVQSTFCTGRLVNALPQFQVFRYDKRRQLSRMYQ